MLSECKSASGASPVISRPTANIRRWDGQDAVLTIEAPPPHYQTRFTRVHDHRHHPYKDQVGGEDGLTTPRKPEAAAGARAEVCDGLSPREKEQLGLARRTDKVVTFLQSARERKIPVRFGKWHPEEDAYLRRLVELFHAGVLDAMPVKVSMRGWLAKMLNCCPMRISKKQSHGEKFEGKIKYTRDAVRIEHMTQAEYDTTCDHVARLRADFLKAWAKDEITRRSTQTDDMTFEDWYSKVIVLVPTPSIARNQSIIDSKRRPQPTSVSQFRQELAAEGKRTAFRARRARDVHLVRRKLGDTATKRTLGHMLDALVKSTKMSPSSSPSSSSSSDASSDGESVAVSRAHTTIFIKEECVEQECAFAPLGDCQARAGDLYASSQPFAEDAIPDAQPLPKSTDALVGGEYMRYKLPVLRFDLSKPPRNKVCSPTARSDAPDLRTLNITVSNCTPTAEADDSEAPTSNLDLEGDAVLADIALLATDADLFSLDEIPLDSWLYDSLTTSSSP